MRPGFRNVGEDDWTKSEGEKVLTKEQWTLVHDQYANPAFIFIDANIYSIFIEEEIYIWSFQTFQKRTVSGHTVFVEVH